MTDTIGPKVYQCCICKTNTTVSPTEKPASMIISADDGDSRPVGIVCKLNNQMVHQVCCSRDCVALVIEKKILNVGMLPQCIRCGVEYFDELEHAVHSYLTIPNSNFRQYLNYECIHLCCSAECQEYVSKYRGGLLTGPPCRVCGISGCINQCARCVGPYYCGQKCQIVDWKNRHKTECQPASSEKKNVLSTEDNGQ